MTQNADYGGHPLTRVRSEWTPGEPIVILGVTEHVWTRRVSDGTLTVIVGEEPEGWHLSISFADHRGRHGRYPRWDEIAEARYQHTPDDVTMVMFLPPPEDYVALHDTTFHLHEYPER
ncbi:MAG TPA: hypothetical protein VLL25_18525, partial [Acidimicrobiales bacterium]|nr:hypothetical protein [Acidimicrobiales bacterium]